MSNNLKYSGLQTFGPISAEQLSITGEYSLPLVDGTANQILSTDGLGSVQFIDLSNLQIVTATNILNGTGINWTIIGLNTVQGDVTLAPFSTTNLAEGANLYFTNERVDDRVNSLVQPGITGNSATVPLTWLYNDGLNTLTPQISISSFTTDALPQGVTNLYFSGELVDDRVAALLKPAITGTNPTNPIVWNYVDGLDSLTPQVSLAPFTTDALSEGLTNLYFTDNRAIDAVGGSLVNSATVTWNFNPLLNTIEATASTGISGMSIRLDGGPIGTQPTLEFLTGTNVILTGGNDILNNKVTLQIDSTFGGNLEDLNDVFFLSPGPQFEEVLYFNGAAWTSIDIASIIPPDYESITYSNLKTKVLASDLIPGRKYLISDYRTIYIIPGTSPQIGSIGAIEPLVVTATSIDQLSPIAFSPSNPYDIIHYVLNPTLGFRNSGVNSKGVIYYREDTLNRNIYPADFREIICRRWDDGFGFYEVTSENGNAYLDYSIFSANCFDNIINAPDSDVLGTYGISEYLPNIYLPSNSVENRFSAASYGITFGATGISLCKFEGLTVNSIFRSGATTFTNRGSIINSVFKGLINSCEVKFESNSTGIFGTTFEDGIQDCEFATVSGCTFSSTVDSLKSLIISNSTFSGAVDGVEVEAIIDCTFNSTIGYIKGLSLNTCSFAGVVSGFNFRRIENVSFGDITNCNLLDYINTSPQTVGTSFERNTFLQEIVDSSFGNLVTNCTFNGKVSDSTFGDTITDCFFASQVDSSFIGDDVIRTTFNNRILSTTIGNSGMSYCTFANEVKNCNFDNSLTSVFFNGQLDTVQITSASTALDKVTFITPLANFVIATGSANLADGTKYTEVVVDSLGGSGNLYERYIDLVGSPALPEYIYSVLT